MNPGPESAKPPVLVRTYSGPHPQASGEQYAADAARLTIDGYRPTSQQWNGPALTVTYQLDAEDPTPPVITVPTIQVTTVPGMRGLGQGIGFGLGCLLFILIGGIAISVFFVSFAFR